MIADDLTGALDTVSQFGEALVLLDLSAGLDSRVVALSTDSRRLSPSDASEKLRILLRSLPKPKYLYKKVDSTMRGNVGAELEAVAEAAGKPIPFTPAFPEQGRIVVDGRLIVDGVPLEKTQYVEELPVKSSSIMEILSATGSLKPCYWGEGGGDVLVFRDVRNRDELSTAFNSIIEEGLVNVISGSAGLAMELSRYLGTIEPEKPSSSGPILIVSGSKNPTTLKQLENLSHHTPLRESLKERREALAILRSGRDLAVASYLGDPAEEKSWWTLADFVDEVAPLIGGLIIVGGETSKLILERLGAKGVRIGRSPETGIAAGWIIGGRLDGKPLLTKAGGFGGEDILVRMWRWLR